MALIQTRVSTKTEKWVERQAKKAGLSKAAWLRNHLVMLQSEDKVQAKKRDMERLFPKAHRDHLREAGDKADHEAFLTTAEVEKQCHTTPKLTKLSLDEESE